MCHTDYLSDYVDYSAEGRLYGSSHRYTYSPRDTIRSHLCFARKRTVAMTMRALNSIFPASAFLSWCVCTEDLRKILLLLRQIVEANVSTQIVACMQITVIRHFKLY
jgi:hypothetical protein